MRRLAWMAPLLALALTAMLGACAGSSPHANASASGFPRPVLDDLEVEPVERPSAGIEIAFDASAAAEMVAIVPEDLDFATDALICVYLGERPTSGWRLDLVSATIADGEMRILARENPPRGDGGVLELTYPADCALVNRAALPPGELAVRADDTIADEFIVSDSVVVPDPQGAP